MQYQLLHQWVYYFTPKLSYTSPFKKLPRLLHLSLLHTLGTLFNTLSAMSPISFYTLNPTRVYTFVGTYLPTYLSYLHFSNLPTTYLHCWMLPSPISLSLSYTRTSLSLSFDTFWYHIAVNSSFFLILNLVPHLLFQIGKKFFEKVIGPIANLLWMVLYASSWHHYICFNEHNHRQIDQCSGPIWPRIWSWDLAIVSNGYSESSSLSYT